MKRWGWDRLCSFREDGGTEVLFILLPVEVGSLSMADFYMYMNAFIIFVTAKTISYLHGFVADMLK